MLVKRALDVEHEFWMILQLNLFSEMGIDMNCVVHSFHFCGKLTLLGCLIFLHIWILQNSLPVSYFYDTVWLFEYHPFWVIIAIWMHRLYLLFDHVHIICCRFLASLGVHQLKVAFWGGLGEELWHQTTKSFQMESCSKYWWSNYSDPMWM